MKVAIAPAVVIEGASVLAALPGALPSGVLPPVEQSGDNVVDEARQALEAWWSRECRGTTDNAAALHQLVVSTAKTAIQRDCEAAAELGATGASIATSRAR